MAKHALPALEARSPLQVDTLSDIQAFGVPIVVNEEMAALSALATSHQADPNLSDMANEQATRHLGTVMEELTDTRAMLRSLKPEQKDAIEQYLMIHVGQPGHRHIAHRTLVDWLGDSLRGATDQELFDVLRSHVDYVAKQQRSPAFKAAIKREKVDYLDTQDQAVRDRHFSEHALTTAHKVMSTRVVVGDVWDTVLQRRHGYHFFDSGYIVITQSYDLHAKNAESDVIDNMRKHRLLQHEGDHVQFGHWESRWSREALAEHNALSLSSGKFTGFSPRERGEKDSGIYWYERELMSVLTTGGLKQIMPDVVTRAHTSAGAQSPEWQQWMKQLDRAWRTTNMYAAVSSRIEKLEARLRHDHPNWPPYEAERLAVKTITDEVREHARRVLFARHMDSNPKRHKRPSTLRTVMQRIIS